MTDSMPRSASGSAPGSTSGSATDASTDAGPEDVGPATIDDGGGGGGDDSDTALDPSANDGDPIDDSRLLPAFVSGPIRSRPGTQIDDGPQRRLRLDDLVSFFSNPARAFLGTRLGIELPRAADERSDSEPIVPGYAEADRLAARLLAPLIDGRASSQADALRLLATAGGEWPEGLIGAISLPPALARLTRFAARVAEEIGDGRPAPVTIDLNLDVDGEPWRLTGSVDLLPGQRLVRYRFGPRTPRDRLDLWIRHLSLAAAGAHDGSAATQLSSDDSFRLRAPGDAVAVLADLIALYRDGLTAPLPFYPKAAWRLVGEKRGLADVTKEWIGGFRAPSPESQEPSVRLVRRGLPATLDETFVACAHRVFEPLLAAVVDEAKEEAGGEANADEDAGRGRVAGGVDGGAAGGVAGEVAGGSPGRDAGRDRKAAREGLA